MEETNIPLTGPKKLTIKEKYEKWALLKLITLALQMVLLKNEKSRHGLEEIICQKHI